MAEFRIYKAGEIICKEGTPASEFYMIKEGKVKVFKTDKDKILTISILGKGDCLGELSFFLSNKRTASVQAVEDTTVQVFDEAAFKSYLLDDPYLAIFLLKRLSKRLVDMHTIVTKLKNENESLKIMHGN